MSIAQRAADAGDRPVASDRRVDRAGPVENACDTPGNLDDAVGPRFHTPLDGEDHRPHAPHAHSL